MLLTTKELVLLLHMPSVVLPLLDMCWALAGAGHCLQGHPRSPHAGSSQSTEVLPLACCKAVIHVHFCFSGEVSKNEMKQLQFGVSGSGLRTAS